MMVIRPIQEHEVANLQELLGSSTLGITSLSKDAKLLEQRIQSSLSAFENPHLKRPIDEKYLFVLEDYQEKKMMGVCGIHSNDGVQYPHVFYKIESSPAPEISLPYSGELLVLHPARDPLSTEMCSLFLSPNYRQKGAGKLLSLSRFLFMASFPERFNKTVFADMRAYESRAGYFPFWEGLGRRFLDVEYQVFLELEEREKNLLAEILVRFPIQVPLLSSEVRDVIGKVHNESKPALMMLIDQGFVLTREIDVFDGGPKIEAVTNEIKAVKESVSSVLVRQSTGNTEGPIYIISNENLDFRACLGTVEIIREREVALSSLVMEVLNLEIGDKVRYYLLPERKS